MKKIITMVVLMFVTGGIVNAASVVTEKAVEIDIVEKAYDDKVFVETRPVPDVKIEFTINMVKRQIKRIQDRIVQIDAEKINHQAAIVELNKTIDKANALK